MLAESAPANNRGRRLSALLVCWYVGYLVAVITSYVLLDAFDLSWRWVLASSALPAIVTVLVRIGFPESPRWLLNHGREQEARAIIDERLGGDQYFEQERFGAEDVREGGLRALLGPANRQRVIFVSVFWACNVAPYFAIFTFAPTVLKSLALHNEAVGTIAVNAMAAIGALVGMLTIERVGRRRQLIPPFWIMAVALAVVGVWSGLPGFLLVACFAVFSFMNALQGNLTAVYPIEIFPTEIRSTGVGFAAACSRVGAAAGTFLLPIGISSIGTNFCMLIAAAICVVGALLSQRMAPETTGQDLHKTSTTELAAARSGR
jgi:putative MFS transporter